MSETVVLTIVGVLLSIIGTLVGLYLSALRKSITDATAAAAAAEERAEQAEAVARALYETLRADMQKAVSDLHHKREELAKRAFHSIGDLERNVSKIDKDISITMAGLDGKYLTRRDYLEEKRERA